MSSSALLADNPTKLGTEDCFAEPPLCVMLLLLLPVCIAGSMQVNGEDLGMRDAARIKGADDSSTQLNLAAAADGAHFMLIEMAKSDD
jgi:hypothetical protein